MKIKNEDLQKLFRSTIKSHLNRIEKLDELKREYRKQTTKNKPKAY